MHLFFKDLLTKSLACTASDLQLCCLLKTQSEETNAFSATQPQKAAICCSEEAGQAFVYDCFSSAVTNSPISRLSGAVFS